MCPKIGHEDQLEYIMKIREEWDKIYSKIFIYNLDKIYKLKGNKRIRKKKAKKLIKTVFYMKIAEHSEYITKQEAKSRQESYSILYGEEEPTN